jgi:enoyl-CoA hydratase/3-hydroxyacyl-CoA dehydrogenase
VIGPFQLAKGIGYDKLARICEDLARKYGVKVFEPTKTLKEGKI